MHLSQEISDSWSPHSICWAERKEMKRNVEWKKGKNEEQERREGTRKKWREGEREKKREEKDINTHFCGK